MSDKVYIFDTTLRDGEQSPGATMNIREKVRLARQIEQLGVDVIEAGFPASSEGDFEAVQKIASTVEGCQIAGLCRCTLADIDRAWEAVKHAKYPRIHAFLATSDIHLEYKLNKTREQVLQMAKEGVARATELCSSVEFSAEDASRTDPDFLVQVVQAAVDAGASVVNIPDTVGYSHPEEFAGLIRHLQDNVLGSNDIVFSVHCHNDLGLAVANTLAALKAGARQAEVTLSGIGERAGNAALEEVVMALEVRKDYNQMHTNVDTTQLYPACRLLSMIIGQPIPSNKAVIGTNAFAHEAGIHQAGMLKNRQTYEIMTPESVGKVSNELVIGKHSGRHAVEGKLQELGYRLNEDNLQHVMQVLKELADRKKNIYVEDLEAVVLEEVFRIPDKYKLIYLSSTSGNMAIPTAVIRMEVYEEEKQLAHFGAGPIDAVFNTINQMVNRQPQLVRYSVNAITGGADAQGEVTVRLEENGMNAVGRAADADIIISSAKAYINALNRLAKKEEESSCPKA